MTPYSLEDGGNLPSMISRLAGATIRALALVGTVGAGPYASVIAFITPDAAGHASFRHAIEMEGGYSAALTTFDAEDPPFYGGKVMPIDLSRAAAEIGIDRVLCLVTLDAVGMVNVVRDYDGVEVTLLEAANTQFMRFMEIMDADSSARPTRLH